ncbi:SGNH hydrolase domain-containing protein [Tamilnaduibacter salinus]|uniref:SGNH hydrolase domain-containing protein n=1 Tax=Tamilnaduibacter salinus TaxID=1484056 RepID=UPI0039172E6F
MTLKKITSTGSDFLIIAQPPRFEESIPDAFLRSKTLGLEYDAGTISENHYKEQSRLFFDSIDDKWRDHVVSFDSIYCSNGACQSQRGTSILYKDSHHISNSFAETIGEKLGPMLSKALR